ncbi:response regulator transcription factor [Schnuerera sp. xch1]|uniref:response regulator transcription factor n=1 Tax=Schnuerera sp. xch1 TaxID=2874283 RepID=UPI001CBFA71B|nr:response regulator transcription factor [Schnuerera sp. xch1]MBZ2174756.1 response regulator transcription factor [Schnuerera sp. xch1]
MNILVVDDEKLIVKGLKKSLEQQGYSVSTAYNGEEALIVLQTKNVDFIILDLMLPDIDGMMLCKKIREIHDMPILMLTAKDGDYDKILGFELGADDYMTKPFNVFELIARIKAITRRSTVNKKDIVLSFKNLIINYQERKAYKKDEEIKLTAKEFDMLYLLAKNPGRVFTREEIFNHIWEEEPMDVRTIDVHIKNLREKIETEIRKPKYILTKWGVGYYFNKN